MALDVPPPFSTEVTEEHYQTGQYLSHDQFYPLITSAPLTRYHGWFGPRDAKQADRHEWTVDVYSSFDPKVAQAYATAKDGFEADLNEGAEFHTGYGPPFMYARFERKHFRWGNGVSFFSQSGQDTGFYVPNNGHLTYEVWAFTHNHRYTVVAHIGVSHPKLADWGPGVRDARAIDPEGHDARALLKSRNGKFVGADEMYMEALKTDPDFKLVETCSPRSLIRVRLLLIECSISS